MPANTLLLNEYQVGKGPQPRWIEVLNPGTGTISLQDVVLRVSAPGIAGKAGDTLEFGLAQKVGSVPGGEVLLLGHIPESSGSSPYYALTMVDIGATFVLPLCKVKAELIGPKGIIDSHSWDLCAGGKPPSEASWQTVQSLDPAHADLCESDKPTLWCETTATDSPTKPTPGKVNLPCDLDGDGYTATTGDCDDDNKAVNPIAKEQCNGVDDDCNSQTDEGVLAPAGTCLTDGVCAGLLPGGKPVAQCDGANGFVCTYPAGFESVNETLCDGFDNDCDGATDEGLLNACGGCGPLPLELCNGKDDDCDGDTDEDPELGGVKCGGEGVCNLAQPMCDSDGVPSCQLPASHEVTETLCDGVDNDCDGLTDEELGLAQTCIIGRGQCAAEGVIKCAPNGSTLCDGKVGEPVQEICGDNLDNDCNGETDEGFNVGEQCTVGLGACAVTGKYTCPQAPATDAHCDATPAPAASQETCDNQIDDDCDGLTDEAGCTGAVDEGWSCSSAETERVPGGGPLWLLFALAALLRARRQTAR